MILKQGILRHGAHEAMLAHLDAITPFCGDGDTYSRHKTNPAPSPNALIGMVYDTRGGMRYNPRTQVLLKASTAVHAERKWRV